MKTSESGVELIKRFEGLELESYQDIAGVWTIGYGHTETAGPNQRITEREAEELLRRDLRPREDAVDSLTSVPLNQNEFDALVSFVYNVGINAYRGSTARRRLNRGDRIGAAEALQWWNKATVDGVLREVTGLTRRRTAEAALFLTPVNPPIVSDRDQLDENSRVEPIEDAPRRGSLTQSRTIQGATVAGGAGATAASMGRDSAEELDEIEEAIAEGEGMEADHHAHEDDAGPEDGDALPEGAEDVTGDEAEIIPEEQLGDLNDSEEDDADAPSDANDADPAASDDEAATEASEDEPAVIEDDPEAEDAPTPAEDGEEPTSEEIGPDAETPTEIEIPTAEVGAGDATTDPLGPEDLGESPDAPAPDASQTIDVEEAPVPDLEPSQPDGELREETIAETAPPAPHKDHTADAEIQLALMIMVVLSIAYVIFARIDDWFHYRR